MKLEIAVLSGDGVGPVVTAQAIKVLEAIAHSFDHVFTFRDGLIGGVAIDKTGEALPKKTLELCADTDAILLGAVGALNYDQYDTVRPEDGLLQLRKALGLFANIRPVRAYEGLIEHAPLKKELIAGINIVIYRELASGIYFGKKAINDQGTIASDICEYTQEEIERIAHLAFRSAQQRKKHLTLVDKANILASSKLWRKVVLAMADQYPDVTVDCLFVDDAAMQLVLNPKAFDVILTDNMFGNIIADQVSVLSGSMGLLASASIGATCCLFEPMHGAFPEQGGNRIINPMASILSVAMLLAHFKLHKEAIAVQKAVEKALELHLTTADLSTKNPLTAEKVGDFIYDYILNPEDSNINFENIHVGQSTII